jgi:5-formyltetrahydrofolate cyclo-ligase
MADLETAADLLAAAISARLGGERSFREPLATREGIRRWVWARLGSWGSIPTFAGASAAAAALARTRAWRSARVVVANPDLAQEPVRQRALEDGKLLYMATPRLAMQEPFVELDPTRLAYADRARAAALGTAVRRGRLVAPEAMEQTDLFVVGSVAVGVDGARVGKGSGYSDIGFALAAQAGVTSRCAVATTVDPIQVLPAGVVPTARQDVPVDLVATPWREVELRHARARPSGVFWELVDDRLLQAIPRLAALAERLGTGAPR